MEVKKVLYDGDPGHDDAMAILLAQGDPSIDLLGVTTVAGNTTLANATRNALMLKDLMRADFPVAAGCDRPLVKPLFTVPEVHGETGLDGAPQFEPRSAVIPQHACDFLIDTLMASDDDIYLVAAGPLTNIATALRRQPAIEKKIRQLVFMGGGRCGNITPAAEFNIWADGEAAKIVFDSSIPKVMCGLDLTRQATADPPIMERLRAIDTETGRFVVSFMEFINKTSAHRSKTKKGYAVNDACCIAYLIDPTVFTASMRRVDLELKGEFTYGMTCIDMFRMNSGKELLPPNMLVGEELDHEKFWDMMIRAIRSFA